MRGRKIPECETHPQPKYQLTVVFLLAARMSHFEPFLLSADPGGDRKFSLRLLPRLYGQASATPWEYPSHSPPNRTLNPFCHNCDPIPQTRLVSGSHLWNPLWMYCSDFGASRNTQ